LLLVDDSYVKMARATVSPYIRRNSRLRPLTSCIQRRNQKGGNLSTEGFEEEVLQLKKKIQYLNEDNMLLKIKLNKYDAELKKKEKEIKDLLSSQKHSFMSIAQGERGILLNSLKQRVIRLEHLLREKDELIRKLKCDIRSTRLNEAAIEIDTLYGEINRLKAMCGLKKPKSVYSTSECSSYDTLSNVASWTSRISGGRHAQREKYDGEKKRTAQVPMSEEENNTDGNFQKESSSSSVDNEDVKEKVDCSDDCARNKLEKATSVHADVSELENLKERMKLLEDSLADRETRLVEITNILTDCQEQLTIQQKLTSNKVDKCSSPIFFSHSSEQFITEEENRFFDLEKSESQENDAMTSQTVELAESENSSSEFNNGKSDRELKMASRLIVNVVKAHLFRLKQIEALKSSNLELSEQFQSGSVDQNFNENGEIERKRTIDLSTMNANPQVEDESENDDDDDHIVVVENEKSNELYNFDIDSDADIIMVPDSPEKSSEQ
ncbi:IQ domain-containing protein E, partial [Trichinella pseudospiralis]